MDEQKELKRSPYWLEAANKSHEAILEAGRAQLWFMRIMGTPLKMGSMHAVEAVLEDQKVMVTLAIEALDEPKVNLGDVQPERN